MTTYELYIGGKSTGVRIRPDGLYPAMWRVILPGDRLGPMGNFGLAKAAAMKIARPRGRGNAVAHWRRSESRISGRVAGNPGRPRPQSQPAKMAAGGAP